MFARARIVAAIVLLLGCGVTRRAQAAPPDAAARAALAATLSGLIRQAIPTQYDKQKDWGATKEIVVGVRPEGRPFHIHWRERKKTVNHGVWKHYKLRIVEPDRSLRVHLTDLRPLPAGKMGFTLQIDAQLDAWSRAKLYQYGVHLIALEVEGDMQIQLDLAGEVGLQVAMVEGAPGMAVVPVVTDARLSFDRFNLRRVSNARGPLVRELSDGVGRVVEEEINGPRLVAKINRAIDKKRDRLVFTTADLLRSQWWPLSRQVEASAEPVKR
jgi:hypothetical protein